MPTIDLEMTVVTINEEAFCKDFGRRMARFRKEQSLTQQQLADVLGLKQYAVANYETGRYRVPVALLPELARALGVTAEDLLGLQSARKKPGRASKLEKQMEQISSLPKEQQKSIIQVLDMALKTRV